MPLAICEGTPIKCRMANVAYSTMVCVAETPTYLPSTASPFCFGVAVPAVFSAVFVVVEVFVAPTP